jgi:hypothetical protein
VHIAFFNPTFDQTLDRFTHVADSVCYQVAGRVPRAAPKRIPARQRTISRIKRAMDDADRSLLERGAKRS